MVGIFNFYRFQPMLCKMHQIRGRISHKKRRMGCHNDLAASRLLYPAQKFQECNLSGGRKCRLRFIENVEPLLVASLPSSAFAAKAFTGARFVKGFNHLPAAALAADPVIDGAHRVIFLSSDDEDATSPVAGLAKQLGFAPVNLGKLNEGGALVHARGRNWGHLIFQDLFKKEQ